MLEYLAELVRTEAKEKGQHLNEIVAESILNTLRTNPGFVDTHILLNESLRELFRDPNLQEAYRNFTDPVKKVIFYSRIEALKRGDVYIGTEHCLLALARLSNEIPHVPNLGFTYEDVVSVLKKFPEIKETVAIKGFMLSSLMVTAISIAQHEAEQRGYVSIYVNHLILGLTSIPGETSVIGKLLQHLNVDRKKLHDLAGAGVPRQEKPNSV